VAESAAGTGLRSVLANRRFALWLASEFSGILGYSAWSISVLWLAYQISGTLLVSALVLLVQYGFYAITFIAGPFVDRLPDKRTVYLVTYPLEAVAAATVGVALATGHLTVPLLLGAVAVMALLEDFWWTASNTVPRILVGKDQVLRANGLATASGSSGSLAGYSVGAALIIFVGVSGGAFLFAGLLAIAALLVLPVSIPSPPAPASRLGSDFREGWGMLAKGPGRPLLQIGALFAVDGFFLGAPALLITLFSNRGFSDPSHAYGLLFTAYVVGAVAGGLTVSHTNPRHSLGRWMALSMVGEGAAVALAVLVVPQLLPSIAAWFAVGLASSVPPTLFYAYLQATTPPGAIGRVVSNMYLLPGIASAFGALAFGTFALGLSPGMLGYLVAVGLVGAGVASGSVPVVRRMRF